ncbi:uncharacterized protein LOC133329092 [Musca vetustissima]|uniref:uncharacterized protein LOC133329092 n=1 Tax=Musca vetustissima TaxID=27455 RepID=UPI002AB6772A|nr:uncharacterized protein LOC133329092 [Musca vetustissima]
MFFKVILVFFMVYVALLEGTPPPPRNNRNNPQTEDIHPMHSHMITIERLEALLRRASEIFKPHLDARQIDLPSSESQQVAVPMQYMQPPSQPYNFYLPLYDYDESDETHQVKQHDGKSRKMDTFSPPPKPKDSDAAAKNFYDIKPKKSPKKFNASNKHINIKWLNNYEKQLSSPGNKQSMQVPKDVYLMNDERNRINFDDTFFAVDMKVPDRTNKLDNKSQNDAEQGQHDDYLNQGEEDLIAAAAIQIPLIRDFTSLRRL